MEYNYRFG